MQRSALLLVTLRAMPHGEVCMVPAAGGGGGYASSLAPAFVVNGTNQGREVARPTTTSSDDDDPIARKGDRPPMRRSALSGTSVQPRAGFAGAGAPVTGGGGG